MKQFWNERFSAENYMYGEHPNIFYMEQLTHLQSGNLLLPGEGEGRNAVWAARHGWKVTAVDYSEAGKEKAMLLAQKHETELEAYIIEDLNYFVPKISGFDAVALIFVHMMPDERIKLHTKLIESLRPGGILILESFSKNQLKFKSGGPKNLEMLYDIDSLKIDFEQLTIDFIQEEIVLLEEGQHHLGEASVIRMIARKQ